MDSACFKRLNQDKGQAVIQKSGRGRLPEI